MYRRNPETVIPPSLEIPCHTHAALIQSGVPFLLTLGKWDLLSTFSERKNNTSIFSQVLLFVATDPIFFFFFFLNPNVLFT